MTRFNGNLDYIFFLCGLSFFLLAAVCVFLRKEKPAALSWRWLALFALAQGISGWLNLAAISFGDSRLFIFVRLALMALTFCLLIEFARRSKRDIGGRNLGAWIYIPIAVLALAGWAYDFNWLNVFVRYVLAPGAGLFAGVVMCQSARNQPGQVRRPLLALGALLCLYALPEWLRAFSGMSPGLRLQAETLGAAGGFTAPLLQAALAALMAAVAWMLASTVWLYSRSSNIVEPGEGRGASMAKTGWLPLAALLTLLVAGWVGTGQLGSEERVAVVRDGRNNTSILYFRMNEKLLGIGQTVSVMAESADIVKAAKSKAPGDIGQANSLLDRFQKVHDVDVCYLLDAKGITIASSNRKDPLSFIGDNYAFRPYFKEGIQGNPARYFALGNTTKTRGYYASSPVTDSLGRVLAVAVIKKNLDSLEEEMRLMPYAFFVSPEGVVFLSGRKEFLFSSLWPVGADKRDELLKSNQFGPLAFEPLWKEMPADSSLVYLNGEEFYLSRLLSGTNGWSLISLAPTRSVRIIRFYGIFITFVLCLLVVGLFVIFTQYAARRAEALELMRIREEKRILSGLLPVCASCRKIRDDKEYRSKVEAYISSHLTLASQHGICPDCARKRGASAGGNR